MARGLRGVRDDLSELARHLVDIACFLHPLLAPSNIDSPPSTPRRRSPSPPLPAARLISGALSDSSDGSGSVRRGLSRLAVSGEVQPADRAGGGSDDSSEAARGGAKSTQEFGISSSQRDCLEVVDKLGQNLAASTELRHLHASRSHVSEIEEVETDHSTHHDAKSSSSRLITKSTSEESIDQWLLPKIKSQESMDRWSEIPSDVEFIREGRRYSSDDLSASFVEGDNVIVMEKYTDSFLSSSSAIWPPPESRRRKPPAPTSSGDNSSRTVHQSSSRTGLSIMRESSWHVSEDSDFEVLES